MLNLAIAMKTVYAFLLSLLGLVCIVYNRFAVEETRKIVLIRVIVGAPPVWLGRTIVILSGIVFCLLGLLTMMGYLE